MRDVVNAVSPRSHALSAALGLCVLSLAVSGAVLAAQPADPLNPAMKAALKRDVGVDENRLRAFQAVERLAMNQADAVERQLGADFAGSWIERDASGEYRYVVGSAGAGKASAPGVQTRRVAHSLAKLRASHRELDTFSQRLALAKQSDIHSWRIDLPSNSIVVAHAPQAQERAIDFVASSGADPRTVRFETSSYAPKLAASIIGGNHYWMSSGGWCSIGFGVNRGATRGFITAGHCGGAGTGATAYDNTYLGFFESSSFPTNDFAFVNTSYSNWYPTPFVHDYAGGLYRIFGSWEAPVGSLVCRSGARTGFRCGYINARNVTVNYGGQIVYNLTQSSACVGQGDSGGSFLTPAGQAQGVTSGGSLNPSTGENCSLPSPVTFDQPVNPILWAYGLTLQL